MQKKGLSMEEAENRIRINGKNMMSPPKQKPKILIFLGYAFAPFSIFLWIASILCFIAYGLDSSSSDNLLVACVLIAVILLTSLFSYLQSASSAKVIEGFKKMVPLKTKVVRDGRLVDVNVTDITVGDVVEINLGEKIPADIRIIESAGLKVDNSSLTGETDPISKGPQMTDESPLETKNIAFYLTSVITGNGRGIVVKTGDDTMIGRIASLATQTTDVDTPIRKEMNAFVMMITFLAITMSIPFFIAGWFLYNITTNIVFLVGILVANVPEGVLVSISVCLTLAAKKMAKKAVIIGINDYAPIGVGGPDLNGCIADARDMANSLVICGFSPSDIRILTNQNATKNNIITYIKWLLTGNKAGDSLVLYYSGHGTRVTNIGTDLELDGLDEAICPHDYTSSGVIRDDEFKSLFKGKVRKGVSFDVFFDCFNQHACRLLGGLDFFLVHVGHGGGVGQADA